MKEKNRLRVITVYEMLNEQKKKKRNKLSGNHVLSDEQPFNGFIKYSEFFSKLENKNICRH